MPFDDAHSPVSSDTLSPDVGRLCFLLGESLLLKLLGFPGSPAVAFLFVFLSLFGGRLDAPILLYFGCGRLEWSQKIARLQRFFFVRLT
jgi:hypothetical protein